MNLKEWRDCKLPMSVSAMVKNTLSKTSTFAVNFKLKLFLVTIADVDIESPKYFSIDSFSKYLCHMLVRFGWSELY